jgi:hypothetical protein
VFACRIGINGKDLGNIYEIGVGHLKELLHDGRKWA